jgi:integral membrane protein (TIGR01906 family)
MAIRDALRAMSEVLLVICVPVALLLLSVDVISSSSYVRHEYGLPGFPPSQLYPPDERLRLAEATVHYLRSPESEDYLQSLQYAGDTVYNEREVQHLVDVKNVMRAALAVEKILLLSICVIVLYLLCGLGARETALRGIARGCALLWGAAMAVGLVAVLNFDWFFTQFHRLFFADGTWTFYETDTLIQLFPLRFWMDATWKIGALALGGAALLGAVCCGLLRRSSYPVQNT